jgi:hypothetical protein
VRPGMAIKPFRILSSPSRALKGHGSKGSWVRSSGPLAGSFVRALRSPPPLLEVAMSENNAERMMEMIAATEATLLLAMLTYYSWFQLPRVRSHAIETKTKQKT